MLPHFSLNEIDLVKSILSFATALLSFLAFFKKIRFHRVGILKKINHNCTIFGH
jgi:hypothetical protein